MQNLSSLHIVHVATTRTDAPTMLIEIGDTPVKVMLDSGSSVSLIRTNLVNKIQCSPRITDISTKLITASGVLLPMRGLITTTVKINNHRVHQDLIVVDSLMAPVILGTDFLSTQKILLDFTTIRLTLSYLPEVEATIIPKGILQNP